MNQLMENLRLPVAALATTVGLDAGGVDAAKIEGAFGDKAQPGAYKLPQLIAVLGSDNLPGSLYQDINQKNFFSPLDSLTHQEFLEFHLQLTGAVYGA